MKKAIFLLLILVGFGINVMAQPGFDDDVQDTPIDGGVVALAIGAAAFGAKAWRKK